MILEAPKRKTGRKGGSTKILAGQGVEGINLLQEKFIEYYTNIANGETFGNGLTSYALAYGFDLTSAEERKIASVSASKLLCNSIITNEIGKRIANLDLNDQIADSRLAYLLNSFDDKRIMLGAVSEYNRLKGRIKQQGNTVNVLSIQGLEDSIKSMLNTPSTPKV